MHSLPKHEAFPTPWAGDPPTVTLQYTPPATASGLKATLKDTTRGYLLADYRIDGEGVCTRQTLERARLVS